MAREKNRYCCGKMNRINHVKEGCFMKLIKKALLTLSIALFVTTPLSAYIFKALLLKKNGTKLILLYDLHIENFQTFETTFPKIVKELNLNEEQKIAFQKDIDKHKRTIIEQLKKVAKKVKKKKIQVIVEGKSPSLTIWVRDGKEGGTHLKYTWNNEEITPLNNLQVGCEINEIPVKNVEMRKWDPGFVTGTAFKLVNKALHTFEPIEGFSAKKLLQFRRSRKPRSRKEILIDLLDQFALSMFTTTEKQIKKTKKYIRSSQDGDAANKFYNDYIKLAKDKTYANLKNRSLSGDPLSALYFKKHEKKIKTAQDQVNQAHLIAHSFYKTTRMSNGVNVEIIRAIAEAQRERKKVIFVDAGINHFEWPWLGPEKTKDDPRTLQTILKMGYKKTKQEGGDEKDPRPLDMKKTFKSFKLF